MKNYYKIDVCKIQHYPIGVYIKRWYGWYLVDWFATIADAEKYVSEWQNLPRYYFK